MAALSTIPDADNRVNLEGVLLEPAKYRVTPSGRPVSTLELEHVSRSHGTEPVERLELRIPVLAMGLLAEESRGFPVGTRLRVEGRLNQKRWIRDEKVRWGRTELVAQKLQVLPLLPLEPKGMVEGGESTPPTIEK